MVLGRGSRALWAWMLATTYAGPLVAQAGSSTTSPPPTAASEQPATVTSKDERARLALYFEALGRQRLVSTQTAKVEELRALLAQAEQLALAGRHEQASLLLFDLTLHPRFADYAELAELDAARYQLGASLHALGANAGARRILVELLRRGPESGYFAPGFRKYVDVALDSSNQRELVDELRDLGLALPEDAQNELRYLSGRERHASGDDAAAQRELEQVSERSRFYANAQYILGAIDAREQRLREAERKLCRIAGSPDDRRLSFLVDGRYFQVKDLARLGLGRLAHEMRRGDDAFYYYFQVSNDSPRLPEAMFEAAYATYEARDHDTAIDLLDQLEARFPGSAWADEAALLRGYVALARCDYESAQRQFDQFIRHFEPVVSELQRIEANPVRRQALYEELIRREQAGARTASEPDARTPHSTILSLLRTDPEFLVLHERVRKLDAEAARAGRLEDSYALIAARLAGGDRPREAVATDGDRRAQREAIQTDLADAKLALRALTAQLDTMRRLAGKTAELASLERDLARLAKRARTLEDEALRARLAGGDSEAGESSEAAGSAEQLLADDLRRAGDFERRVALLRPRLIRAANERALVELRALRERLGSFVRRARIGRIDAVMGSKRRVERQIESLAAGRFPAELQDPLLIQGFLNDDEEYWPFEGDDWPDEYLERYGEQARDAAPATSASSPKGPP